MDNISNINEMQYRKDKALTKYQKIMILLSLIVLAASVSYIIVGAMSLFNSEMSAISELCETKRNRIGTQLLLTSGILAAWLGAYCIVNSKYHAVKNQIKVQVSLMIVLGLAIMSGAMLSHWQHECSQVQLKKLVNYKANLFCGVVFGGALVLFLCLLAELIFSRREITKQNEDISIPDSFLLEEIVVVPNPIPPPPAPETHKSNPRHVVLREIQCKGVKQMNDTVTNHTINSIPEIIVNSFLLEVVAEIHPIPPPFANEIPISNPRHVVLR